MLTFIPTIYQIMHYHRRRFLKQAITGAVCISTGNTLKVLGNNFTLPPANKLKLRVAIGSDGHYGEPKTAYEQRHTEMIRLFNAEKADRGVDFAFINGDLFHNDVAFFQPMKKHWDTLTMPYFVSHGNHDMVDEETWTKTFNHGWHYGFENKDIGFVVLNTADVTGKYVSPDVEKTRQLLQQYAKYGQLFVFMHITPIKWTTHAIECPEIVEMFNKQFNLKAVFHGHDHDQDSVKENAGKCYFFDSHISGSWGTDYYGYRILEVMENGEILTYQMNPGAKAQVNSRKLT
ncbi:hypothetical protein EXU57_00920 [Segetibacter sp. 3557_3]|uniref:metallophosphoesterase family protein n=1 Tax=Segetibacter sp. 3557_3 TaxID=2547429 RepID=UPI0010588B25|nr:metallophosphoesterase [Segetibacter sp. 3557_3]TDH28671.1 hypothetical protein EXU57_00920 [Segetibacter sp. 3557_3]